MFSANESEDTCAISNWMGYRKFFKCWEVNFTRVREIYNFLIPAHLMPRAYVKNDIILMIEISCHSKSK